MWRMKKKKKKTSEHESERIQIKPNKWIPATQQILAAKKAALIPF